MDIFKIIKDKFQYSNSIYFLLILLLIIIVYNCKYSNTYKKKNNNEIVVCIIGGGLTGIVSAINIAENGGKVILLEKEEQLGGNSAKASSGINAAETTLQKNNNINDTKKKYYNDTYNSSEELSTYTQELIYKLTYNSKKAIKWLQKHGVTLNDIKILGGHSVPRTHRNSNTIHIGSYLIGILVEKLQNLNNVKIITNATVNKLIYYKNSVIGLKYNNNKKIYADSIILTTGGFGANNDLIKYYREDLNNLPTTNGKWSTGDGINLVKNIGANLIDMNKIQVHPTGFIDPNDRNNNTKVLAAEMLRGIGGILINKNGNRFCNELGRRDYIVNQMKIETDNNRGLFYLLISKKAYADAIKMINYYESKELLISLSLEEVITKYKLNKNILIQTITKYNSSAKLGNDTFGKSTFNNTPININEQFYIGEVIPTVHYCMGGVQINKNSNVIDKQGQIINRLYAAGEVIGGLHSVNRLGGNSLIECVVFGIISARNAIKINKSKYTQKNSNKLFIKNNNNISLKKYTKEELSKYKNKNKCIISLYNKVYDITQLINSHPGGSEVLIKTCGTDATDIFSNIHDKNLLSQLKLIGNLI